MKVPFRVWTFVRGRHRWRRAKRLHLEQVLILIKMRDYVRYLAQSSRQRGRPLYDPSITEQVLTDMLTYHEHCLTQQGHSRFELFQWEKFEKIKIDKKP